MARFKTLALGAALGVFTMVSVAATSGSATVVIITPLTGGTVTDTNPLDTIPATRVTSSKTYDFTFSIGGPIAGPTSIELTAQYLSGGTSVSEPIAFSLYEGTPTTSDPTAGVLVTSLGSLTLSPVITESLTAGDYYIYVSGSDIVRSGEDVSGSVTTAGVPEPASWALMLIGFGGVGAGLRLVRRPAIASAT